MDAYSEGIFIFRVISNAILVVVLYITLLTEIHIELLAVVNVILLTLGTYQYGGKCTNTFVTQV